MARLVTQKRRVKVYRKMYRRIPITVFIIGTTGSPPLLTMFSIFISGRLTARAEETMLSHCIPVGNLLPLLNIKKSCRSNCGQDLPHLAQDTDSTLPRYQSGRILVLAYSQLQVHVIITSTR